MEEMLPSEWAAWVRDRFGGKQDFRYVEFLCRQSGGGDKWQLNMWD